MNKKITVEVELSDWAKFVATDEDGNMWEYEIEPFRGDYLWVNTSNSRLSRLAKINQPMKNWKDSLIRVEDL